MGERLRVVKERDEVTVLVVEDDGVCRSLMCDLLAQEGFRAVTPCENGRDALALLTTRPFDIVLTDLNMPILSGETLVREALRVRPETTVLVVSGRATVQGAVELIKEGVYDFLAKPFDLEDFRTMVSRALSKVERGFLKPILASLLVALERKDVYLKGHSERVARVAAQLAALAGLPAARIELLRQIALVHDVGKIGVPEHILNKPGPLTPEEWCEIKKHPVYTSEILRPLVELRPGIPFALHHHERFDGTGYPAGLAGREIPLEARIIAVVDAFDAMASNRAYRLALDQPTIAGQILAARGSQFDPELADLFLQNLARFAAEEGAP